MTNGYATHLHFIGKVTEAGGDTMVSFTGKQSQSLTNPQSMALLEAIRELLGGRTSLKEVCYLRWAFRIHSLAPLPVHSSASSAWMKTELASFLLLTHATSSRQSESKINSSLH